MATSNNGIDIKVRKGDLITYRADVIVNSIGPNLNLSNGPLSRKLSIQAGPELQQELNDKYPNGNKKGHIAVSKGHGLNCKRVYHVNLARFTAKKSDDDHTPEQVLFATVQLCLQMANKYDCQTIAFPTLGLGFHGFSPDIAAEGFCEAVRDFERNNKTTSLTEVHVVAFEKENTTDDVVKIYKKEATREVQASDAVRVNSIYKKGRPKESHIPPRGTKDFIKYIFKQPLKTPSYWTKFTNTDTLENYLVQSKVDVYDVVDVDAATLQAITKLVQDTWQADNVGHGVDAQGLKHSRIHVTGVKRIENILQFYAYANHRQQLFRKVISVGSALLPIHKVAGGGEPKVLADKCMAESNMLRRDLYNEVNECYLFHGTETDVAKAITTSGLDSRLSSEDCMHGKGVYFAESSTKADQYADRPQTRSKHGKVMIMARVCLGESFISDPWLKFKRAPCKQCFNDTCIAHKQFFDSVVTKAGAKLFREFVVYLPHQAYPEYIVSYNRV